MAAAARVRPKDYFTAKEWASLSGRSSWLGLALVAHCWAVIVAAGAVGLIWPLALPLVVMIIGGRQLGLAILMHDAAHGALHPNLKVNDWVARNLCEPTLDKYRPYHLTHHRFAQQAEDPDLVLSAPFPISRRSLARKIFRDLTGQTYVKLRFAALRRDLQEGPFLTAVWKELARKRRLLIGAAATTAVLAPFGYWWGWFAVWLLPSMTWYPMVTRLRNIAEHALVAKDEPDPLRHARTTKANLIERALLAPYWVNYHCEHHMFMHLPCYRLPKAHGMLAAKGVTERMEVQPGYLDVLKMAAPA